MSTIMETDEERAGTPYPDWSDLPEVRPCSFDADAARVPPSVVDAGAFAAAVAAYEKQADAAVTQHHANCEQAWHRVLGNGGTPCWEATPETFTDCGSETPPAPVQNARRPAVRLIAAIPLAAEPQASTGGQVPDFTPAPPMVRKLIHPPRDLDTPGLEDPPSTTPPSGPGASPEPRQDDEALDQVPPLSIGSWGTRDDEGAAGE